VTSAEFVAWPNAMPVPSMHNMPKARIRIFIVRLQT
jgi:hypothetical protein